MQKAYRREVDLFSLIYKAGVFMASKQAKVARNSWEVDFVNVSLSKEQKLEVAKWDVKGEVTFDIITKLVDDGFKLSISADKAHDCVGAYLTEGPNSSGNRKRCLSARGPDFFGALRSLVFKHSIILEGDWGDIENTPVAGDRWG
jgi:hypothetical protein